MQQNDEISVPAQAESNNSEINGKVYELGYLLVPTITEESVPAVYTELKDLVASLKGVAIADEMPHMMSLAYQMVKVVQNVRSKYDSAYFGWMKFEMDSQDVLELKKKLDLDPNVIRFLLIKTVRENTIASKKFVSREGGMRRKMTYTKKEEKPGEAVEINKEEIDKEIDAMIEA